VTLGGTSRGETVEAGADYGGPTGRHQRTNEGAPEPAGGDSRTPRTRASRGVWAGAYGLKLRGVAGGQQGSTACLRRVTRKGSVGGRSSSQARLSAGGTPVSGGLCAKMCCPNGSRRRDHSLPRTGPDRRHRSVTTAYHALRHLAAGCSLDCHTLFPRASHHFSRRMMTTQRRKIVIGETGWTLWEAPKAMRLSRRRSLGSFC